jgi:hypothetical protein
MAVTVLSGCSPRRPAVAPPGSIVRADGNDQADVVVRVYDHTRGVRAGTDKALAIAAEIFGGAGIKVQWRVCIDPRPDPGCTPPPASGERLVRMMQSNDSKQAIPGTALGYVVDKQSWLVAHMYIDRVGRQSAKTGCNLQLLLGRAIAHEIGHLLLEDAGHSLKGLMRAMWTDTELQVSQPPDWQFNSTQAAAMRARLGLR